jgi:hypothetical protein
MLPVRLFGGPIIRYRVTTACKFDPADRLLTVT